MTAFPSEYTYAAINLASIAGPLAYGFTRHSGFNRRWRHFLPALFITASLFIAWDILYTAWGVWGFNSAYHLGMTWWGLPLEEIGFFFCIPFACLFLYDVAERLKPLHLEERRARILSALLAVGAVLIAWTHRDRIYTLAAFGMAACFCLALALGALPPLRRRTGHFLAAYALHLLPFLVVNGLLTALPVVIYDNGENLGIRLFTIPVEDAAYSLGLLGLNVWIYEALSQRAGANPRHTGRDS